MFVYDDYPKKAECKGLVFRGYRSIFYSDDRLEVKQGIKLLKRKSCPGCQKCLSLLDNVKEFIANDGLIIPEIEDRALYSIRVANIHKDWETGIVDDYDIEIFKLKEEVWKRNP